MKKVALIGMPNTGKSTLFNRLTGAHARIGNWPGITVDLLMAKLIIGSQIVQIVDLPGIYDLNGYSEDEQVVTTFLAHQTPDLIVFVMNASHIDRQSTLLNQLLCLNIPMLVVMTMADEAQSLGITISLPELSHELNLPICLLSAKYGQGMENLQKAIQSALTQPNGMNGQTPLSTLQISTAIQKFVQVPQLLNEGLTQRLDKLLLHPWLGLPIFLSAMFLVFHSVFTLGKPMQDALSWLFTQGRELGLEPALASASPIVKGLVLDGIYNGLSTVASFVPLIILFFIFLGLVEDTGYLARAAFLMDALMSRFGLDGRSFVMFLMGFGCNVPALMGTRVLRSRGLRLLTMLTIPFSLCSARLQVFVFFAAALFTEQQAPWVLFSLYIVSLLASMATALIFKRQYINQDAFVLEMPPYRLPTLKQVVFRGWHEVQHFLNRATRFIVLGVVLVWLLTNFPYGVEVAGPQSWAGQIGELLAPVLQPIGITPELTIALIFGFVAKEIVIGSLAVIFGSEGSQLISIVGQQVSWIQAYSFMLFTLIYTPCLSTAATMLNESKSRTFTLLSGIWSVLLAWCTSYVFYQLATQFISK